MQSTGPFIHAIGEWLQELKEMPTLRTARSGKANPLIGGLTRDIAKLGLFGFYDLTKTCETYQDLQRVLSAGWTKKEEVPKKSKKQALVERVRKANEGWNSDAASEASEGSSQDLSSSPSSSVSSVRRVSFLTKGCTVTAHDIRLAPSLNNQSGTLLEAEQSGRFLVKFAHPACTVSLPPANLSPVV